MKKRKLRVLAALLALALLLGGCRMEPDEPTVPAPAPVTPSESAPVVPAFTTFGLPYSPNGGLNPYSCTDLTNRTVLSLLYESLFRVDASFAAKAQLCEDYTVSGDGRTHVLKIKPHVLFSDGTPLTALCVVSSIRAAIGSAFYGTRLSHLTSVVAYTADTVTITTDTAYETLSPLLDMPIVKDGTAAAALPVGTGPYVADPARLQLRKNADYRSSDPALLDLDVITLVAANSAADVRDLFEYGSVSLVCADPNANGAATYHSDFELWSNSTTVMQYLGFNVDSDIFSIAPLRAAVTYAINREQIISENASGFAAGTSLPVSPFSKMYDQRLADSYGYNPAAFQAALAASELKDLDNDGTLDRYTANGTQPLSGTLLVCNDSDQRVKTAQSIASTLGALGVSLSVVRMDRANYLAALRAGSFDLYYGEVRLPPNFDLTPFFRDGGALNYGGIADSAIELLCRQTLENSGNAYDLYQTIMERGLLCPVLFKTYAVYVARGRLPTLSPYLDCVLCAEKQTG